MKSKQQESSENLAKFFRGAASLYAVALFMLFAICDSLFYPQHARTFWILRIVVVISILVSRYFVKKLNNDNFDQMQLICSIPFIVGSSAIVWMVFCISDHSSSYWGGLGIILTALSTGFSFSRFYYALISLYILLIFGAFTIWYYVQTGYLQIFLQYIFLIAISISGSVGRWFYNRLERDEYSSRVKLNDELENRNLIIKNKTEEATRLRGLSRQFSPRLIECIEQGVVDLSGPQILREISVLFIDIKDSTHKVLEMPAEATQKIITLFIADVMGVMNKHDMTIDKFVGDGVIGFTNAPLRQDDHVKRSIECALEVCALLEEKSAIYDELWGGPFEYRIGMACGEASVGFYGNDDTIKTYTALGMVINLANRMNGKSPLNSIVVTGEMKRQLEIQDSTFAETLHWQMLPSQTLKGFETANIEIWNCRPISSIS
ncbi:MAG: adenylate/guanylate cyclase domain-containing protein [Bacteriovoracaceae bacterium]|nr:adenylate/guanylate cyclase domain-containing protein [Bacteriovoracaceae bacterium]